MKTHCIIVLALLSVAASGQELPDLSKYKKDIGFNSSILLNGLLNTAGGSFDLMMKKQKSTNTANRIGLSLYADLSNNSYTGSQYYNQQDQYEISLSFGKERQNQITKNWIFYYGGDLEPFYRYYQQQYYALNQLSSNYGNSDVGVRAAPFMGIRFQINERLYISTESRLLLSYSRKKIFDKTYDNGNQVSERNNHFNNFRFQVSPASGIFLFYRF